MAKSDELVMYITRRVATFLETPREERKRLAAMQPKEHWSFWWFGYIPFSTQMTMKRIVRLRVRKRKAFKA